MRSQLRISVEQLARFLQRPTIRRSHTLRTIGPLHVLEPGRIPARTPKRWQTILSVEDKVLLLVDEFHASGQKAISLVLKSTGAIVAERRRYACHDAAGPVFCHPLGDYHTARQRRLLTLSQNLAQGRFLIALTRDPHTTVRVLNGWSAEIRSEGRVYQLLHSNRSRRLRPLGPIQTDALFALAAWPSSAETEGVKSDEVSFWALQATQIVWEDNRKLMAAMPTDLSFQKGDGTLHVERPSIAAPPSNPPPA